MADFSFPALALSTVAEDSSTGPLPLTARSTVVDRSKQTAPSPLVIGAPVQPLAKAPRSKVPLEKGYSQVDWLRLTRGSSGLNTHTTGAPLRTDITLAEVRQHRTPEDAWMVLRGKVYNITPYLKFHPGGVDILLKAAGKDGTLLFQKYHPWVNADALLEKCLIGKLAAPPAATAEAGQKGAVVADGAAALPELAPEQQQQQQQQA